jgi:hypothetical protein
MHVRKTSFSRCFSASYLRPGPRERAAAARSPVRPKLEAYFSTSG